jgi:hypothetical protein
MWPAWRVGKHKGAQTAIGPSQSPSRSLETARPVGRASALEEEEEEEDTVERPRHLRLSQGALHRLQRIPCLRGPLLPPTVNVAGRAVLEAVATGVVCVTVPGFYARFECFLLRTDSG